MNAARPAPGVVLARCADVPEGGAIVLSFRAEGASFSLLLARRGSAVFAYENICPHAAYPLQGADGRLLVQEGRYVVCHAHGASFALDGGACAGGPCNGEALTRFAIEVRDGAVFTPRSSRAGPNPARDRDDGA